MVNPATVGVAYTGQYLVMADIIAITGVSRASVYTWLERGILPKPVKLGGRVRWLKADIDKWLEDQAAISAEAAQPIEALLGRKDFMKILGVNNSKFQEWRETGIIPKPFTLGNSFRWLKSDIDEWLVKQAAVNN